MLLPVRIAEQPADLGRWMVGVAGLEPAASSLQASFNRSSYLRAAWPTSSFTVRR
jgi:hypothetical protein